MVVWTDLFSECIEALADLPRVGGYMMPIRKSGNFPPTSIYINRYTKTRHVPINFDRCKQQKLKKVAIVTYLYVTNTKA